jgi:3-dehydroquinate dehydratase II
VHSLGGRLAPPKVEGTEDVTKILVLQGANMIRLGRRQPEIYGTTTADELDGMIRNHARERGFDVEIAYYSDEGAVIDALHEAADGAIDGVVMNPGGLCYSGYALRDCMKGIELPVMEVHMSNHYARGIHSVTAEAARGVFLGLGVQTYMVALDAALWLAKSD